MNRLSAILGAVFVLGLIVPLAATEHHDGDMKLAIINTLLEALIIASMIAYCGFAALHATQRVADPVERSLWLVITLGLNVAGSLFYYVTKYHEFRQIGAGGLLSYNQSGSKVITKLNDNEKPRTDDT